MRPAEADAPSAVARNLYDPYPWGRACATGVPYKNTGVTTDGAKNQRRSISSGRKHRGSAADDLEKREKECQ